MKGVRGCGLFVFELMGKYGFNYFQGKSISPNLKQKHTTGNNSLLVQY
jgi:hypothetical protein